MRPARKKDFKKGIDATAEASRRREAASRVRKEERAKSYDAKRQQICVEAVGTEGGHSSIDNFVTYSKLQTRDAVDEFRLTLKSLLEARGCKNVPSTVADWQIEKLKLTPLSESPLALTSQADVKYISVIRDPLVMLRKIVTTVSPPVVDVIQNGGLELCLITFDLVYEVLVSKSFPPTEMSAAEHVLIELAQCLGNILASDEEAYSDNVPMLFPQLPKLFALAAADIHVAATQNFVPQTDAQSAFHFFSYFEVAESLSNLLGNAAADHPSIVLGITTHVEASSTASLAHLEACVAQHRDTFSPASSLGDPKISEPRPFSVLETVTYLLDLCMATLEASTPHSLPSEHHVVLRLLSLVHSISWLLCNLIRLHSPGLTQLFFLPRASVHNGIGGMSTLSKLVAFCSSIPSHLMAEVSAANGIFQSPVDSELRVSLGETLWCLAYGCMAEPRLFSYFFAVTSTGAPVDASLFSDAKLLILSLVSLLHAGTNCQSAASSPKPAAASYDQTAVLPRAPESDPRVQYAVDLLTPALAILTYAAGSSLTTLTDGEDAHLGSSSSPVAADLLITSSDFCKTFHQLLSHPHRGILRGAAELAAVFASGKQHHTEFVVERLDALVDLMHKPLAFDIKREIAICLVHVSLNHNCKYLSKVLVVEPSAIDSFLELFSSCKFDCTTIMVALDFIEMLLSKWPPARKLLFHKNIIEIIESVQHLHDDTVFQRISDIIVNYFDDLDDVAEEEADLHFETEARISEQLL